jgi:hypothetical protein
MFIHREGVIRDTTRVTSWTVGIRGLSNSLHFLSAFFTYFIAMVLMVQNIHFGMLAGRTHSF